jgi:hypothetical protein
MEEVIALEQAASHSQYKVGEVYACSTCGIEVTVTKPCAGRCVKPFMCCGQPLTKKR